IVFYLLMRKHAKGLESRQMLEALAKIGIAGLALAAVCVAAHFSILAAWDKFGFLLRVASLVATILGAGGVFFAVAVFLNVAGIDDLAALLKRKFARSGPG
ncbi:MAG TPA: hypothetical protein VG733_08305, partial [Chthoniobacteraceae bacterium]|nr:hypothetical protein [Chthoniobacteraceae bacterium]